MRADRSPIPLVVARWAAAWNNRDANSMASLFAPTGIYEDLAFKVRALGPRGVARWVELSAEHIPDLQVSIHETVHDDQTAAVSWTFSGTPVRLGPVASTGQRYEVAAVSIIDHIEGRITRVRDSYNLADVLTQVGIPLADYPFTGAWLEL